MRGAFGKSLGIVARVRIGQPVLSVRSKDKHKAAIIEALRRAKFKFLGRQKMYVSKKWGFTQYDQEEYEDLGAAGRLAPCGANVKYLLDHGPLSEWKKFKELLALNVTKLI